MAKIKKLKNNGSTIYPATIWNAVVDPDTGMTLKQLVAELTDALNRVDAHTLQGHGIVTAGELDPKNKIPVVGNDGVMEIGRYLDFHMDDSKEDYNIRLRCDTTGKYQLYLPAKTGTLALEDKYYNLGAATVAASTSSSADVTFTGSSAFSSIRTLLNGLSLTTMSNAMPNISLGFSLTTGSGITHYIRIKVASITRVSNGNYALFAIYQNPSFGDENYVNVLRIVISPSSYSCHTLKSL